jgi:protein-L-isoaspartate(D-aspartate) O-methyltransferase
MPAMDRLAQARAEFAKDIARRLGLPEEGPVATAIGTVPRELFVGPGPWMAFGGSHSELTDDPADLYQDITVALDQVKHINNGQPTLHAICLHVLSLQPGESVLHIGAGTGYYTAIMAELVGPAGHVDAYEIESELAGRARTNLADYPNVAVHARSAADPPLPQCNAIYVNAGCTAPLEIWLDALRPGGRLLFPLAGSVPHGGPGGGAMLLVTNERGTGDIFSAQFICGAAFIPSTGAYRQAEAERLAEAYDTGIPTEVCTLRRGTVPDNSSWFAADGWWLSTRLAVEA